MEESVEEDEAVVCGAAAREEKGVEEEVEALRGQLSRLHAQAEEAVAAMLATEPKLRYLNPAKSPIDKEKGPIGKEQSPIDKEKRPIGKRALMIRSLSTHPKEKSPIGTRGQGRVRTGRGGQVRRSHASVQLPRPLTSARSSCYDAAP
eukprot:Tamp_20760.p1 GENE.Tamp_20760~~Tamp_20760.p1  ORF type:complete len:148 (+),score=8.47 Tamp_20760:667-1110(+)